LNGTNVSQGDAALIDLLSDIVAINRPIASTAGMQLQQNCRKLWNDERIMPLPWPWRYRTSVRFNFPTNWVENEPENRPNSPENGAEV
jgi:hypothetical protein